MNLGVLFSLFLYSSFTQIVINLIGNATKGVSKVKNHFIRYSTTNQKKIYYQILKMQLSVLLTLLGAAASVNGQFQNATSASSISSAEVSHHDDHHLHTFTSTRIEVVSEFTTYCPEATTFSYNNKTVIVTKPTTLTITDCPCTMTHIERDDHHHHSEEKHHSSEIAATYHNTSTTTTTTCITDCPTVGPHAVHPEDHKPVSSSVAAESKVESKAASETKKVTATHHETNGSLRTSHTENAKATKSSSSLPVTVQTTNGAGHLQMASLFLTLAMMLTTF